MKTIFYLIDLEGNPLECSDSTINLDSVQFSGMENICPLTNIHCVLFVSRRAYELCVELDKEQPMFSGWGFGDLFMKLDVKCDFEDFREFQGNKGLIVAFDE